MWKISCTHLKGVFITSDDLNKEKKKWYSNNREKISNKLCSKGNQNSKYRETIHKLNTVHQKQNDGQ